MRLSPRTRLLGLGAAGVLSVAAIAGAGAVLAQEPDDPPPAGEELAPGDHHPFAQGRGVLGAIINASGLEPSVFFEGFKEGKSINQVLEENNVDPATVQAQVVAGFEDKLGEIMDTVPQFSPGDGPYPGGRPHGRGGHGGFQPGQHLGPAADLLGMDVADVIAALREGETLASLAEAAGVDSQAIVDALVAPALERIDEAVANGRLDEARASELKANLIEKVTNFVNNGRAWPTSEGAQSTDAALVS
ncbi:MAG: hypothetical protein Kow0010_26390 [Dehalococcoidia bacterium]